MNVSTPIAASGLALGLILMAAPLTVFAHHSTAPYDLEHGTSLRGVVTQYEWRNPHTLIQLDVTNSAGKVEHWTVETESLIVLTRLGWTKDSLKPGDVMTTIGARAKDGKFMLRCNTVELPNGKQLPCFPQS